MSYCLGFRSIEVVFTASTHFSHTFPQCWWCHNVENTNINNADSLMMMLWSHNVLVCPLLFQFHWIKPGPTTFLKHCSMTLMISECWTQHWNNGRFTNHNKNSFDDFDDLLFDCVMLQNNIIFKRFKKTCRNSSLKSFYIFKLFKTFKHLRPWAGHSKQ
jgi:hypothetical protein